MIAITSFLIEIKRFVSQSVDPNLLIKPSFVSILVRAILDFILQDSRLRERFRFHELAM